MKLKTLSIAGFRGFNKKVMIAFHDRLTVITGPNSHGKTSITEALEFLVYGFTSKVRDASDNKEDFKGSYRNVHYPKKLDAEIEVVFATPDDTETTYTIRLAPDDTITRLVDGVQVPEWPLQHLITQASHPFVVQHALKNFLLASPSQRFEKFAGLLGLHEIEQMQQTITNFCTKPEVHLSPTVQKALNDWRVLEARLASSSLLSQASKAFSKAGGGASAFAAVSKVVAAKVGEQATDADAIAELETLRTQMTAKTYAGKATIVPLAPLEESALTRHITTLEDAPGTELVELYATVAADASKKALLAEYNLLDLSVAALETMPDHCPVCLQVTDESIREHIQSRHKTLKAQLDSDGTIDAKGRLSQRLTEIMSAIKGSATFHLKRSADLEALADPKHRDTLERLLDKDFARHWAILAPARDSVVVAADDLRRTRDAATTDLSNCLDTIDTTTAHGLIEAAGKAVAHYLAACKAFTSCADRLHVSLQPTALAIGTVVEEASGATDIALLKDLLSNRRHIDQQLQVRDALDSLKDLKRHADQVVSEVMDNAFSTDLTTAVMGWYDLIKTSTDPNVHFSGFSMAKAKTGSLRSKKVQVAATSYGVSLASAASSLSESKLNALGLCVCIATATRSKEPWSFIVIDDPIQSWDSDHEYQFIKIVNKLDTSGKQVVLLSHRAEWVNNQLVRGTRALNGTRLEITGLDAHGPTIRELPWASLDDRLAEILSISKDKAASSVKLQQGEEEVRLALSLLVAEVATALLKNPLTAKNINSKKTRSVLTEAGYPVEATGSLCAVFGVADPAHHVEDEYQPNRARLASYYQDLLALKEWIVKQRL